MSKKPSTVFYLVPIFNGLIGSIIMWWVLKDDEHPRTPKMIRNGWIIGIVLLVIHIIISSSMGMMFTGFVPLI